MSHPREETMDGFRSLILWLAMTTLVGCHYRDPSIDLLEGELRYMEDQVYLLEGELHRRCQQLDACRNQNCNGVECQAAAAPTPDARFQFGRSSVQPVYEPIPTPSSSEAITETPSSPYEIVEPTPSYQEQPTIEMPTPPSTERPLPMDGPVPPEPRFDAVPKPSEYEVLEPRIEIPSSEGSSTFNPIPARLEPQPVPAELPPGRRPSLEGGGGEAGSGTRGAGSSALNFSFRSVTAGPANDSKITDTDETVDAHVTHVVAHAELVSERGFDDEVTDADVLVVVEPRNQNGQYVELTGPVSVVVLDANKLGSEARVARWDFDAGSARRLIRSSQMGRGIHLALNWPDGEPDSNNLQLFVRYTTVENRKLEADLALQANPDRPSAGGWRVVDRLDDADSGFSQQAAGQTQPTVTGSQRSNGRNGFTLQPLQLNPPETTEINEPLMVTEPVDELATPAWSPYR
jgi:hypothetical protein